MPCSGAKSATSFTPGALFEHVDRFAYLHVCDQVWIRYEPTRSPASCLKLSRSSTSMPVSTLVELPAPSLRKANCCKLLTSSL
jgi:hypothetical protein